MANGRPYKGFGSLLSNSAGKGWPSLQFTRGYWWQHNWRVQYGYCNIDSAAYQLSRGKEVQRLLYDLLDDWLLLHPYIWGFIYIRFVPEDLFCDF